MIPRLTGPRVVLREPREADIADRLALGRDPEIVRALGGDPGNLGPLTAKEVDAWHRQRLTQAHEWSIELHDRFIGVIRLHSIEQHDRRGTIAVAIFDPTLLGRGLGSEAIRLVVDYAFEEMNLHRVSARVLASNERSIRALKKCGFVEEGRERESARVGANWEDDVLLAVLAPSS